MIFQEVVFLKRFAPAGAFCRQTATPSHDPYTPFSDSQPRAFYSFHTRIQKPFDRREVFTNFARARRPTAATAELL